MCLVAIWASPEFQEKLETSTRKSKLYNKLSEEMAKAGFTRTPDQIINQLKKLKKDYRDTKTDLSKSGAGYGDTGDSYELLDSVMGHRPANQVTGALNTATAATTIDESGSSIYDGCRLTTHHSCERGCAHTLCLLLMAFMIACRVKSFIKFMFSSHALLDTVKANS